jgi:hypothetical protein
VNIPNTRNALFFFTRTLQALLHPPALSLCCRAVTCFRSSTRKSLPLPMMLATHRQPCHSPNRPKKKKPKRYTRFEPHAEMGLLPSCLGGLYTVAFGLKPRFLQMSTLECVSGQETASPLFRNSLASLASKFFAAGLGSWFAFRASAFPRSEVGQGLPDGSGDGAGLPPRGGVAALGVTALRATFCFGWLACACDDCCALELRQLRSRNSVSNEPYRKSKRGGVTYRSCGGALMLAEARGEPSCS